ncbi:MAG: response regulator transcription factor [Candidatus Nanopelagicales bacterium]|nr:response regulator transcription factor [Candidatus Nanopelagicales bacterium]
MTTVLVCDDAPMAREAVRRQLASLPGVERVTAAGSGEEVLARYPLERPDLILMDVRMPGIGGVEATRRLVSAHPDASIMMLTMGEDADGVARAVAGGARGYVAKDASREELASAMTLVLAAGPDVPGQRGSHARPGGAPPALTEREQQVLDGMSRGLSNAGIGKELFLSEDTVKTHARRLFRKVGAADRAQAVAVGFRWGFLH